MNERIHWQENLPLDTQYLEKKQKDVMLMVVVPLIMSSTVMSGLGLYSNNNNINNKPVFVVKHQNLKTTLPVSSS